MRENKGFGSFAFNSAHVKYGVWTWPDYAFIRTGIWFARSRVMSRDMKYDNKQTSWISIINSTLLQYFILKLNLTFSCNINRPFSSKLKRDLKSVASHTDESLLVTCALWWSLWNDGRSEVWSGGQTSGFCVSILSLISTVMHWHWVLHVSTSVFLVQVANISNLNGFPSKIFREGELIGKLWFFSDTLTRRLASWINFINSKITRVWYCDKFRLRPRRHGEQTLTFLYAAHPTWEQTVNSSKCSTVPGANKGIR